MSMNTTVTQGTRWRIPFVLGVTLFVNYLDRNNISLALPQIANDFGWSTKDIGNYGQFLLAAFFLSYGLANIFVSPFAERIGAKKSVLIAITAFSICTIISAPLGQWLAALIGLRLLLGIGEGMHVPMLSTITSRWFAANERGRANSIWNGGILVATALGPLLLVPLISTIGWRWAFVVLGCAGLVISIPLVWLLVDDQPQRNVDSPVEVGPEELTDEEKETIASKVEEIKQASHIRDGRFWLLVTGGILNAFCGFGVLNWLPTYFTKSRGISFDQLGWPLTIVFSAGIVSVFVMGYLGDKFNRRALLASLGLLGAGILVFFASHSDAFGLVVFFFAAAVFCQSAYTAHEFALVQRLIPADRVGAGSGLYNGLAVLIGGVGGSLVPGTIVGITGSLDAGLVSVVVGTILAAVVMGMLARLIKY